MPADCNMNQRLKPLPHYLTLIGVIALGAVLRFWNLDLKPLWLDEVITAIFSLGHSYNDVPLEVAFPLSSLKPVFTLNPAVSCEAIAQTLGTQSTHPPLFFCWMHSWLVWLDNFPQSWVWKLRSFSALIGVLAIVAVYCLNRVAFSPAAGLMGATVMAVSPFAVYLSQEARHYTLPVLLITLALLGLIQVQKDLYFRHKLKPFVWLAWVVVNSIGFWVHYFFILTFIAQVLSLFGLIYQAKDRLNYSAIFSAFSFCLMPVAFFIPWLPVVFGHSGSTETSWVPHPHNVAPLYQTLAGWLLMVIALPVENQPLWITIPSGLGMLLFGIWLGRRFLQGFQQLANTPTTQVATFTLVSFIFCVLVQFLAIVYLLGKDITIAPRYNFVYLPAVCALLGASLCKPVKSQKHTRKRSEGSKAKIQNFLIVGVGIFSCICVVFNWAFQKPFNPQQVAQNMSVNPAVPLMVVVGYDTYQDIALGLSFALALDKVQPPLSKGVNHSQDKVAYTADSALQNRFSAQSPCFAFLQNSAGYEVIWQQLKQLKFPLEYPFNLWVVAPGLKRIAYPEQLTVTGTSCTLDPTQYYRLGIPYQLYECK